jgi:hypothetical protein
MIQAKILLVLMVVVTTFAGKLVEMQVKTNAEPHSEMGVNGHLDVVICSAKDCCLIERLNNDENNFSVGKVDNFEGPWLQGCEDFELDDNKVERFILAHRGTDAWLGDYFRILLTDPNGFVNCVVPGIMDDSAEFQLVCS